ncbi:unnamed protein product [Gulo gulo]|uniref:60S ribosomal protein L18a n=1 Tax=Gulo gulo TaxID=48420 RepID=A0A9X9PVI9_GULGU|nr:unnamed protein product [Gulo gulo]
MRIFAPHHVVTKSCFWYFVCQLTDTKSSGEIVYCGQIFQKSLLQAKKLIWLRYDSLRGTHAWTGGTQNCPLQGLSRSATQTWTSSTTPGAHSIQIGKVEDFPVNKGRVTAVKRFHDSKIKFPGPL